MFTQQVLIYIIDHRGIDNIVLTSIINTLERFLSESLEQLFGCVPDTHPGSTQAHGTAHMNNLHVKVLNDDILPLPGKCQ